MVFWVIAAVLTLCACLAVLLPVVRGSVDASADSDFDIEVYRDQLAEIERDVARGVVAQADAELARAEIGRRILKASQDKAEPSLPQGTMATRVVTSIAVLAVPLASWIVYASLGSPDLPAQPLQARLEGNPAQASIVELVARAEAHLAENPEDGRGWDVLAPIYFRLGRYPDSAVAYRNAIAIAGESADRLIGLGEAVAAEAGGTVTTAAQVAFERALELDPGNPRARYMIASAYMQEGRTEDAAAMLRAMSDELPEGSPWSPVVEQALASIAPDAPGPSAQDIEAASDLSDEERAGMIEAMVAGLDQRLRQNPADPEGWRRLVQSYLVMNRPDAASDALVRGVEALGPASDAARELLAFAAERGVEASQ